MVGETMRYAATDSSGEWVALLGFASPALSCGPRDRFIGWSRETQSRRLRLIASNQRFCVLPAGRRQNTASAVRAGTEEVERGLGGCVGPPSPAGRDLRRSVAPRPPATAPRRSCASARPPATDAGPASTSSTARSRTSTCVRCTATASGCSPGRSTIRCCPQTRGSVAQIDFNTADLSSLIERIETITDPRDPRGVARLRLDAG